MIMFPKHNCLYYYLYCAFQGNKNLDLTLLQCFYIFYIQGPPNFNVFMQKEGIFMKNIHLKGHPMRVEGGGEQLIVPCNSAILTNHDQSLPKP